jgi:N-acetylglucosaminyldiphosphoundecaprenol N-acetyl-beta-D-mannosaminyltransferase
LGRVEVLGTLIDTVTMTDCVDMAERFIACGLPHQLIAINAAKIVLANRNSEFRKILTESDLNFADGQPVVFAARLLGRRLPELVSGHFLMERLVARAAENGHSVYFLGGKPDVVAEVADVMRARHPSLRIAGWRHGFWLATEEQGVVAEVRRSRAQMLFLALGTPRKEEWLSQYKHELEVPVCMGVGGSFDVITGRLKVEPAWIRKAGLAWAFRVSQEPRRLWRRYASTNPVFVGLLVNELAHLAFGSLRDR